MFKQIAYYEIHSLAVTDCGVPFQECVQNISQWSNILIYDFLGVAREGPLQIQLNLIKARIWIVNIVVPENEIIICVHFLVDKHAVWGFGGQ